jgi:DHA2 family methylenomycin A resistance protein-like MFS transporter
MTDRAWLTVAVAGCAQFLAVLSTTVVSVALPTIGRELPAGPTGLQWIVDAYVLVYAGLLVAGGVMGDRRGRKGTFLLGIGLFGLGSLLTGLAPSIETLLVGRVVQGLGPALVLPGSLAIIRTIFHDPRRRAAAIGLWSMSSGLALAVGPAFGGLVVDTVGWRWVFLLNVPVCAALLGLAAGAMPRLAHATGGARFDWAGLFLTTVGLAALAFAIIDGQDHGWLSGPIIAAFLVGLATLTGFVVVERRRPHPLVDVALFRIPAFTVANVAGLVVFFAFIGAIVYFSAYFQQVQGRSPVVAGLDVSAIGVGVALTAPIAGRLVGRFGPQPPMLVGLTIAGGATLGLLRLGVDTRMGAIWWNFALIGLGVGACLTPMTTVAVSAVEADRSGMASAVHNAMRQLGQVLGVAVLGALVYTGRSGSGRLDPPASARFVTGLHHAVWASGLAVLAAAALAALVARRQPPTRGQVSAPDRARQTDIGMKFQRSSSRSCRARAVRGRR